MVRRHTFQQYSSLLSTLTLAYFQYKNGFRPVHWGPGKSRVVFGPAARCTYMAVYFRNLSACGLAVIKSPAAVAAINERLYSIYNNITSAASPRNVCNIAIVDDDNLCVKSPQYNVYCSMQCTSSVLTTVPTIQVVPLQFYICASVYMR